MMPRATGSRWRDHAGEHEAALRDTWGLGDSAKGRGYRDRLRRLCDFLGELEPEPGATPGHEGSDFDKLQRGLVRAPAGAKAREAHLRRLTDLADALRALVEGEKGRAYLQRWQAWPRLFVWVEDRREELERALRTLGALPPAEAPQGPTAPEAPQGPTAPHCLLALWELLEGSQRPPAAAARRAVAEARARWRRCLDDLAADYEWAYHQVLVRLARECLREKAFSPACYQRAQIAQEALAVAIPGLEKRGSNQPAVQGLYGLLATTFLTLGKAAGLTREERQKRIEKALVYARRAVQLAPESIRERLVLLDVLSDLQDPEDIRAQAEIALNLDSGPDTLRTIGGSYWERTVLVRGRGARRQLLREATAFFAEALKNVESAPLDDSCPVDQMLAHGWAHFWMGRFQSERASYAEAAAHLRTASTLGFKPLEAQVELAWTCLLARDRKHADQAFREALAEAARQRRGGARVADAPKVADAPGEERPIDDLAFEGYLGWALLCADWDPPRARWYARKAELRLAKTTHPRDRQLRAALLEVWGRIMLHKGKISEGIGRLEAAVLLSPRSGAYCVLGFAYLSPAPTADAPSPGALRLAREAYRRGRESDVRGRYRRELRHLRRELRKREGRAPRAAPPKTAGAAAPASAAAPAGAAAAIAPAASPPPRPPDA